MPRALHSRGPLPKDQREQVKQTFLIALAQTGRITVAARTAGIHRMTAWQWMHDGFITQDELDECAITFEELVRGRLVAYAYRKKWWMERPALGYNFADSEVLLRLAKGVLPEFGGVPRHERIDLRGLTAQQRGDIISRIRDYKTLNRRTQYKGPSISDIDDW